MTSMRLEMQQKLSVELRMAPHIIQSIEVLTLPALELTQFIQQQLEANPVLEAGENSGEFEDGAGEEESREEERQEEGKPKETEAAQDSDEKPDDGSPNFGSLEREDWADYYSSHSIPKRNDGEKDAKLEAMQNSPERPASLQDHLFEQFQFSEIPDRLKKIGEYLIYNLDSKGYLRYPLEEIAKSLDGQASVADFEEVLGHIQKMDPPGVGARSIQECLSLQLDPEEPDYLFQKELIEKYLLDIYNNRYPKISRETGKSLEEIKRAILSLQKLSPNPGADFSQETAQFIVPDVIVEYLDGSYSTRLLRDYLPTLKINPSYLRSVQPGGEASGNRKTIEFLKKKIESANWVIDAIKQRQHTLKRVANKIVEHQVDFLEQGLSHLKPLKMQDISEDLQIHVSTVSRAISDKYIQTPRGIFPMKFFFTGGIDKKDGENESRVTVQERIQEIVRQEDKSNPLSDEEIALKLKEAGLEIARRTITKYRKALGVASSRRRRQY